MTIDFYTLKKTLPLLGIGLGLRRELIEDILENYSQIDWLEFVPENYMDLGGMVKERLQVAAASFPLVSHGINLSIGSTDDLNQTYLDSIKNLLECINSPWWSDHLCFTSIEGTYMHDLLPLPFNKEAVKHVVDRVKRVQDFVGRPFLLENISFYMNMPGCEMTEVQFLSEILEKADCGLLLDVNNVYVNSINHDFDPYQYLNQIPLERTVQIHVAGHKRIGEYVIDTHGAAIIEPVYELLQYVLARTTVHAVMIERDQNFPTFDELLGEIGKLRGIVSATQPSLIKNIDPDLKLASRIQQSSKAIVQLSSKGGREIRAIST